mmetsp:Transcript_30246/g.60730  ORF Transcript_30246/g.60730 Transcript_30246/m.60730 type:complete len:243 (-) Transcript_30246:1333-2061(-)
MPEENSRNRRSQECVSYTLPQKPRRLTKLSRTAGTVTLTVVLADPGVVALRSDAASTLLNRVRRRDAHVSHSLHGTTASSCRGNPTMLAVAASSVVVRAALFSAGRSALVTPAASFVASEPLASPFSLRAASSQTKCMSVKWPSLTFSPDLATMNMTITALITHIVSTLTSGKLTAFISRKHNCTRCSRTKLPIGPWLHGATRGGGGDLTPTVARAERTADDARAREIGSSPTSWAKVKELA